MSILAIAAEPWPEEERREYAEIETPLFTDAAEEEVTVNGKKYFLFSEETLCGCIESLIISLNTPSED